MKYYRRTGDKVITKEKSFDGGQQEKMVMDQPRNSCMNLEAKEALVNYWGGMIAKGADTFWEAYDPTNDFISPYDFYPINSYCHAWSCTPVYFIRKYPEIFQK